MIGLWTIAQLECDEVSAYRRGGMPPEPLLDGSGYTLSRYQTLSFLPGSFPRSQSTAPCDTLMPQEF